MATIILSLVGRKLLIFLLIGVFAIFTTATVDRPQVLLEETPSTIDNTDEAIAHQPQPHDARTFSESLTAELNPDLKPSFPIFHALHDALSTMQDQYFALWLGRWTNAIDWTAAVMNTHLSATLMSFSNTFGSGISSNAPSRILENHIAKYFAQSSVFYFGEDAFSIRMQAYDDILWVVLEWLESIKFIESHSARHYPSKKSHHGTWHAKQFIAAFEHRARIFYELAEQGWDEKLCGGGLTWNPRLLPYKNAITNQLYISASVGMYLYFPGDANCSPVFWGLESGLSCGEENRVRYDESFLENAVKGYDWLKNVGMTNSQGLYTDGFHIAGYRENRSKTMCDERNEMVYTYNQGVVLSGLRGLWEATGNVSYLEDGHTLVQNVIRATGWSHRKGSAESLHVSDEETQGKWHGLGSDGILTEACDIAGTCNQDGQTFKGIFFHHFTAFCEPLPRHPVKPGKTHGATKEVASLHRHSCDGYTAWVIHNANAALKTRNKKGLFGAWWGAGLDKSSRAEIEDLESLMPKGAIDYRTQCGLMEKLDILPEDDYDDEGVEILTEILGEMEEEAAQKRAKEWDEDPNTRGRGRTVETQGGGLSVVRAMWESVRRRERVYI